MTRFFALGLFLVSVFVSSCGAESHSGPPSLADGDRETETAPDGDDSEVSESDSDSEADTDNAVNDCLIYDSCPCQTSADCPAPLVCHPSLAVCREQGDCTDDGYCNSIRGAKGEWYCFPDGYCQTLSCITAEDCPSDSFCDNTTCRKIGNCNSDDDCDPGIMHCGKLLPSNRICSEWGFCVTKNCSQDKDCPNGFLCMDSICQQWLMNIDLCAIIINEGSGVIHEGVSRQLSVTTYDENNRPVTGVNVSWESDRPEVVSVHDGLLTGGSVMGQARIVAKYGLLSSDPVTYLNLPTLESGARVVVFDAQSGKPLEEASVFLAPSPAGRKGEFAQGLTDALGRVSFPALDCAATGCALHVMHPAYDVVSAFGLKRNELFLALTKARDLSYADGIMGHQNTDAIPAALRGDLRFGMTMFSLPADPLAWEGVWPFGEMIHTPIKIGPLEFEADLPSGFEAQYDSSDEQHLGFKSDYFAVGRPGTDTLWGFGGYAVLGDLIDQVYSTFDENGAITDYPGLFGVLLPLFGDFYFGAKTGYTLSARPKVFDRSDLNRNGRTDELVPDIANFGRADLMLTQRQTGELAIRYPEVMPNGADGKCLDAAVTVIGALQTGIGVIPLGLGAVLDKKDKDDPGDCRLGLADNGWTHTKYAVQALELVGNDYWTISYAFALDEAFDNTPATTFFDHSAAITRSVKRYDDSSNPVAVPALPDVPQAMAPLISETHLTLTLAPSAQAGFQRAVWQIESPDKSRERTWQIYWSAQDPAPDFELPLGLPNYALHAQAGSRVQTVQLGDISYQDLFGFGEVTIGHFGERLTAFSTHYLIR